MAGIVKGVPLRMTRRGHVFMACYGKVTGTCHAERQRAVSPECREGL